MAIYKNNNGTWYVMIRYQDWTGERKQKCKRGFATRKEAADWELQFKLQKKASLDMTMERGCKTVSETEYLAYQRKYYPEKDSALSGTAESVGNHSKRCDGLA